LGQIANPEKVREREKRLGGAIYIRT